MRLAVGTAQFGMNYGITNTSGQPSIRECRNILELAGSAGITHIDTAALYGNSEEVLGELLSASNYNFIVNTKISLPTPQNSIQRQTQKAMGRLKMPALDSVMLHSIDAATLDVWQNLIALSDANVIGKFGASVYTPEQCRHLIEQCRQIGIVQVPLNLFDQRFLAPSLISQLKVQNIEIHSRSLFLQGILLSEHNSLPSYFAPYKDAFQRIETLHRKLNVSSLQLAMALTHMAKDIDIFVVGICQEKQLVQILEAYHSSKQLSFDLQSLKHEQPELINPVNWPARS